MNEDDIYQYSYEEIADEFDNHHPSPRCLRSADTIYNNNLNYLLKVQEIVYKFGFRNKEVVIQEEDPNEIQLTT